MAICVFMSVIEGAEGAIKVYTNLCVANILLLMADF